jgi:hypothetical protein
MNSGDVFEQMLKSGEITRASLERESLPDPVVLPPGCEMPSAVLARLRGDHD